MEVTISLVRDVRSYYNPLPFEERKPDLVSKGTDHFHLKKENQTWFQKVRKAMHQKETRN